MKSLLPSLLIFTLCASLPVSATDRTALRDTPADPVAFCEAALPHMQEVLAAMKAGQPLRHSQDATWRTWNQHCRHASWQQALREALAAMPPRPVAPVVPLHVTGTPIPPPHPDAAGTDCHKAVTAMRTIAAMLRKEATLTHSQLHVWRLWDRDCQYPVYLEALGEDLPAAPPSPLAPLANTATGVARLPPATRSLSLGTVYCQQSTFVRKGQVRSYGSCY